MEGCNSPSYQYKINGGDVMSVYHPIIRFKDKTNYDYELMVGHFDPDSGQVDSYLTMEPIYTETYDGVLRNDFGAKYTDTARPVVTLVSADGSNISPYIVRAVLRWLTGSKDTTFLDICDEDGISVCSYIGRFTDVKLQKLDARTVGIVAYFTSISPFAYSDVKEARFTITQEGTEFSLDCDSDDLYNPLYPSVIFNNRQESDPANPDKIMLSLQNKTINNETIFKNLQTNEVITIDSNFIVYSDNTARIFNDDFNYTFPLLVSGTNDFSAVGDGELIIRFRYPMKLVDGLLNDYDISNDPIVYVEETIMYLNGDLTRNPPAGTSVKINDTTLVVRGTMKSVKLPGFSEVENGNLLVDYGNVECPFSDLRAKVVDGELFIGNELDHVEPDYSFQGRYNM
jgi:hypothetical protein